MTINLAAMNTVHIGRAVASRFFLLVAACFLPADAMAQQVPADQHVQSDSRSVDELLAAARQAARADRNREAADLFARAIDRAPHRRSELLREYADQLTYAGQAGAAVPLYRELIAAEKSHEERLSILGGLGLALLRADRPREARAVYEELVRDQPGNRDAARNLGRALSWSGRQREAARYLQGFLLVHPDDAEARVMLAQAQAWMGRTDLAQHTLNGVAMERDDGRRLEAELQRASAPRTRLDRVQSTQSDQLDINSSRFNHEFSFNEGLGMAGLRLDHLNFTRQNGTDDATASRSLLRGRYRLGDAFEVNAELGPERVQPRDSPATERIVYAGWLTWRPDDVLRFDLSTNRSSFDNLKSLRLGLLARQYALSTDVTPDERQRYKVRIEYGDYSDGNRRWAAQIEGEYRLPTQPEVWVGAKHYRFQFSEQMGNGYFNPRTFDATHFTAKLGWRPGGDTGRWDLSAAAAVGREHAVPDGSKPAYDLSLQSGWRIDARTRLEARAQRFSSRTTGLNGFARTSIGLSVERIW